MIFLSLITLIKRGLMHKSIPSWWSVVYWLHFEEFWEVSVVVVKNLLEVVTIKRWEILTTLDAQFKKASVPPIIYLYENDLKGHELETGMGC